MVQNNPFLIEGYLSPDFFCDRTDETALLTRHITNRCNVALIAPRRLGKSGLIHNCFYQKEIREQYHCIYIDIYDTKNLSEFVYVLGKGILTTLKPKGRKAWETFLNMLQSLKSTISFDINGNPEWSVGIGDIQTPDITLDEIFAYLDKAGKPCLVAIDEFQTIAGYPEKTVEATLRKRIQNCHNARFIFSGSKRHMMALMFTSQSRPFYHSSSIMGLEPINQQIYLEFANRHLAKAGKEISDEAFSYLYQRFDGITWYIQYVLNMLYTSLSDESILHEDDVRHCIDSILAQQRFAHQALLFQLTSRQKQVLTAIAKENETASLMSQEFLHKYRLGASTVQGAVKTLLDRDFITHDNGVYRLCDKFLEYTLREDE
uniref:AAA family ATPase n=1 Tax=Prevotella sp. TaxID=59823 RepID=UPI003FED76C8